jgi:GAF domain-containing protein
MHYNSLLQNPELFEKKFRILQETTSAIVATDNVSAIANLMLESALNYSGAEKGSLMLLSERDELYVLVSRGISGPQIRSSRTEIGKGIAGMVAKNRVPVLVENIEESDLFPGETRERFRTKSFISCPLISKSRLLGVININDKKDDKAFTEDEFDLVKTIADQAAIALENAFLMRQLKAKAVELEEMNKKLIESDIVKTEFLTHVSHELRTPLNSISGAIYYLQQTGDMPPSDQREFRDIIGDETTKLVSIVENLLDFLRLDDETRAVRKTVVNLADLMEELVNSRMLNSLLAKKDLRLETDIKKDISYIAADKTRLAQFFLNLMEGLSHHLETGDAIDLSIHENNFIDVDLVVPRKMPEAILPYLATTRYIFQSDHPREGLNFYLARKAAEFHRWEMTAQNINDKFHVTLTIPKGKREKREAVVNTAMELFIEFISDLLDVNVCSIMLSDDLSGELTIKGAMGLSEDVIKRTRIRFSDRISGWVAIEGRPLFIEDIESDPRFGRKNNPRYNTKSLISVPIKLRDKAIGVLNLNNKRISSPFTVRDLYIALEVVERVSHFFEKFSMDGPVEYDFRQFITSFQSLLDAEKRYHKKKKFFPDLMSDVMDDLGVEEGEKALAVYVSMIYDLGLMFIDQSILEKSTKLSPAEARTLRVHPYTTVTLLDDFEFSEKARDAILHHHERYDGSGYPDGLRGEEIPLISRAISVVDAFSAMTRERPYGKKFTKKEALQEIKKGSCIIYDPSVVKALEKALKSRQPPP